jgi:hypothetical protein
MNYRKIYEEETKKNLDNVPEISAFWPYVEWLESRLEQAEKKLEEINKYATWAKEVIRILQKG